MICSFLVGFLSHVEPSTTEVSSILPRTRNARTEVLDVA